MSSNPVYRRVLLKLSGEALMGDRGYGLDPETVARIARQVRAVHELGVEVCIVVGGGNIFRGVSGAAEGMERATADHIGMLATVINALAIQTALEATGVHTRVQSAIPMDTVCEPFIRRRAERHLAKKRVVVFGGGTGNPFFTTDTAAALKAVELNCDILLKGTKVDGIYSADPLKNPKASRFDRISHEEVIARDLRVMDTAAFALARDNKLPILVYALNATGGLAGVLDGRVPSTRVG